MYENPRLFTKNNIQTCRNQNQIKMKPKSNTQDNVLQMNMKNMNLGCPKNPAYIAKPRKYILSLQTELS
jgi:hypothetical protein